MRFEHTSPFAKVLVLDKAIFTRQEESDEVKELSEHETALRQLRSARRKEILQGLLIARDRIVDAVESLSRDIQKE